ncbi:MAG: uroporphyrinogen decarboxylase [Gammaproteobacteria bacterium]|nr:uroporphyrinogen decarboxylase [Gammaproteobacteria bacterium]MDH3373020.1 uroporphyrinogen decarboxylase [Gammaproteobacteria bacterium]MDH3408024.1 uroporphyrinogen decarboxylase [Gammaproteobacteria bacterium]
MIELQNDLLLRALLREPVERTPLWIMRQAGRYLPEYREVRARAGDFMSLCRNPELACEVTLQPLRRYKLDAAILFSDILTVPDAMGLGLYFETGEGPKFERPVRSAGDIRKLRQIDVADDLAYVFDAVRTIRRELDGRVPLIGFAGSPWTVGTYMVEGGSSREFRTIKGLAAEEPKTLDALLDTVARTTVNYLNAQIESGAQVVMVFDTWGAALEPDDYRRFSLASMQKIVDGLTRESEGRRVPVILFTKGAGPLLTDMVATGCDALGVDWTTELATARGYVEDKVALQGNLDPATLRESPQVIRQGVADTLASYGTGPGHVFNLGHGITPDVDPDNVAVLVDAVHEMSPSYHQQ